MCDACLYTSEAPACCHSEDPGSRIGKLSRGRAGGQTGGGKAGGSCEEGKVLYRLEGLTPITFPFC